jgi:hypothetical protein
MSQAPSRRQDAVTLLDDDHIAVKKLFTQFKTLHESGAGASQKEKLVQTICEELTIHMAIEEEIFYPAARRALGDDDLMDESTVEHAGAKNLIKELRGMHSGDPMYDAKVTVLGEQIDHHVEEEREEMFPKARQSDMDLVALRNALSERKAELKDATMV